MQNIIWKFALTCASVSLLILIILSYTLNPPGTACLIACILILLEGRLIYRQNPASPLYRAFLYLSVAYGGYMLTVYALHMATHIGIDTVEPWVRVFRNGNLLLPPLLIHFTRHLLQKTHRFWSYLTALSFLSMLPFIILGAVGQYIFAFRIIGWTYVPAPPLHLYRLCGLITMLWAFLSVLLVVAHIFVPNHRPRRHHYIGFVTAFIFAMVPALLGFLPAFRVDWFPSFVGVGSSLFPIILGLIIARFEVFDIKIVIRRTLPYAIVTAMIGCFYALLLLGARQLAGSLDLLPQGTNDLLLLVVIGIMFQPILEESRAILDKVFFREEASIEQMLADTANRYGLFTTPQELVETIRADIRKYLQVEDAIVIAGKETADWIAAPPELQHSLRGLPPAPSTATADTASGISESDASSCQTALQHWRAELIEQQSLTDAFCLIACREKKSHLPFSAHDHTVLRALLGQGATTLGSMLSRNEAAHAKQIRQTIFDATQTPILILNTAGFILECNPAATTQLGVQTGSNIPTHLSFLGFAPDKENHPQEHEIDGKHYLVSGKTMVTASEEEYRVYILTEMTELVQLHQTMQEREALALLGSAISAINHEILNIISPVGFYLHSLEKNIHDPESADILEQIRNRISLLELFSHDLREYYREPNINPREMPLRVIVDSVLADLSIQYAETWTPPHLNGLDRAIHADPARLRQILFNLLKNAWQAMENSPTHDWRVNAYPSDGHLVVEIQDSGSGIADDLLPHLFTPFVTTKRNTGTGLGLPVCKRYAEAHGARINATNAPDGGAIFRLHWPIQAPNT